MVPRSFQTVASLACLKTLVVVFNIFFLLSGLLLLTLGIWLHIELHKYMDLSPETSETVPYILIGTGLVILVLAVLACCCTYKEQPILLYIYAGLLTVVFIVEVAACLSGYALRLKLGESFQNGLATSINQYGFDYGRTAAVNNIQNTLHCCGVESYKDWSKTRQRKVPGSCCKEEIGMSCETSNPKNIYNTGCYSLIFNFFSSKMKLVAGLALALAAFQMFGIFLAMSLAKLLRKTQYEEIKE